MPVTVAATQMACTRNREDNMAKSEGVIRAAAKADAQIILPQEVLSRYAFRPEPLKPKGASLEKMEHL